MSDSQAFAGIAPNLVRRGIPAVVAMQYSIKDTTAKQFADEFYRTLALVQRGVNKATISNSQKP